MKILIIGASGGTGKELVRQALEQGHEVAAFVRQPRRLTLSHPRLSLIQGDVLDPVSVGNAVRGKDAVLCALGHKRWFIKTSILSRGTKNIVASMEQHGVERLLCETSLGVGDSWGRLGLYYTLFVQPVIVFFYFRDKGLQEKIIRSSRLKYTIVRPGQLTNGAKRGTYKHGPNLGNWIITPRISRADVADFMLKQLTDPSYERATVAVTY